MSATIMIEHQIDEWLRACIDEYGDWVVDGRAVTEQVQQFIGHRKQYEDLVPAQRAILRRLLEPVTLAYLLPDGREGVVRRYLDGYLIWTVDGRPHREDGPAIVNPDRYQEWWLDGHMGRADGGPGMVWLDGHQEWRVRNDPGNSGYLHRDNGPAVIGADGMQEWWHQGQMVRPDGGPNVVTARGTQEWRKPDCDDLHRLDGPARITARGTQEWWVHGKRLNGNKVRAFCLNNSLPHYDLWDISQRVMYAIEATKLAAESTR